MPAQHIITDMSVFDDEAPRSYAIDLGLRLTDNLTYPTPTPEVDKGLATIKLFGEAISQVRSGGAGVAARKNQLRTQLAAIVLGWGDYATTTTPGNTVAWLSTGFRLTKDTRDRVQPLPMPTALTVDVSGDAGTARLQQPSQATTRAYVFGWALVPAEGQEPVWHWALCGKPDCLVENLPSEKPHLFVAGAWNGALSWPALCAPVRRTPQ